MHKDCGYLLESDAIMAAITPHIITAFSKNTGLLEAKCYLLKRYMDTFELKHA
jgi:hypothetical protein